MIYITLKFHSTLLFEEHDKTQELVYVSSLGQGSGAVVGDVAKGKQKFRLE